MSIAFPLTESIAEGGAYMHFWNTKTKIKYYERNFEEHEILYNGIDRIDNSKGYNLDNCVTCCTQCNTAKMQETEEDFKKWIIDVYNNLKLIDYKPKTIEELLKINNEKMF